MIKPSLKVADLESNTVRILRNMMVMIEDPREAKEIVEEIGQEEIEMISSATTVIKEATIKETANLVEEIEGAPEIDQEAVEEGVTVEEEEDLILDRLKEEIDETEEMIEEEEDPQIDQELDHQGIDPQEIEGIETTEINPVIREVTTQEIEDRMIEEIEEADTMMMPLMPPSLRKEVIRTKRSREEMTIVITLREVTEMINLMDIETMLIQKMLIKSAEMETRVQEMKELTAILKNQEPR